MGFGKRSLARVSLTYEFLCALSSFMPHKTLVDELLTIIDFKDAKAYFSNQLAINQI